MSENRDPRVYIRFNKYNMTLIRGFNGRKIHCMDPEYLRSGQSMMKAAKHLCVTVGEIEEVFENIRRFMANEKK